MLAKCRCWVRGCIHYEGVEQPDGTEASEVHVCGAFPEGIPEEICDGHDLHLEPDPSQVDYQEEEPITFQLDPDLSDEALLDRRREEE